MQDKSGAHVAPDGSSRSIMPADSGGVATQPRAPGHDRRCASPATLPAHDRPHVTPSPPPGHDCSRRVPTGAKPRPTSVTHPTTPDQGLYDWTFTTAEVQRLAQAATAPVLDAKVRLLQVLIQRVVATDPDSARPRPWRRGGAAGRRRQRAVRLEKLAAVGRAVDVLQRTLKTRQALAADSPSELYQLLDEAAAYMEDAPAPADHGGQSASEEHDP